MRERKIVVLMVIGLLAWATGCKKQIDTAEFKSAINNSFAGRHECIWPEPTKLPAEVDTSKYRKAPGQLRTRHSMPASSSEEWYGEEALSIGLEQAGQPG